ncbi:hypothetical protein MSAN_00185200 [Mycena sanguinolenta]|uniref:F-box domain-containing protein n=1 Tax=Mycena sanguinolenta TaxID=230812 RepID=A0A8H6ZHH0_9AGAR|nr:hypothetical protein MSAN_00185200 [Mycena sanguinolenta]
MENGVWMGGIVAGQDKGRCKCVRARTRYSFGRILTSLYEIEMSVVAQFPHELLDLILVHHSEDSACLKACSLVCRAWFFSSRSLLFRTCILRPRNIRTFRALLLSPDCTILPHVRKLDVFRNWFHDDDGCFNEVAKEMRHHCRHIHSLQMGLFLDHEASEAQLDAFLCQGFITAFTHITSLELTCDYYSRDSLASPLLDMLCLFYGLQALHMRGIYGALAAPVLESSLELDLQLYRNLDWAALDAFLSPARFPRLQKVTVACPRRHNSDSLFLCNALPLLEASGALRTVR